MFVTSSRGPGPSPKRGFCLNLKVIGLVMNGDWARTDLFQSIAEKAGAFLI